MPAEVLPLRWDARDALQRGNFESRARELRYQALGRACVRHGIQTLLLGHHRDDQAETVLGRIVEGYTGLGLEGMKRKGGIPLCEGVFWGGEGMVVEEEGTEAQEMEKIHGLKRALRSRYMKTVEGGAEVHRPLLGFSKEELVRTCKENELDWVEDETNQIKTLTLRNTVRYLLESRRLPQALRATRVLEVQAAAQAGALACKQLVAALMSLTVIRSFNMQSSVLVVQMTVDRASTVTQGKPALFKKIRQSYLEHLAQTVSPKQEVQIDFTERLENKFVFNGRNRRQFTAAGVLWTPVENLSTWMLRREPFRQSQSDQPSSWWPISGTESQDGWQLWDGRFWIRVRSHLPREIQCRALTPADITQLKKTESKKWNIRLGQKLKEAGPDATRYTLPVLVECSSETILALPTLGLETADCKALSVESEVRYKNLPDTFLRLFDK